MESAQEFDLVQEFELKLTKIYGVSVANKMLEFNQLSLVENYCALLLQGGGIIFIYDIAHLVVFIPTYKKFTFQLSEVNFDIVEQFEAELHQARIYLAEGQHSLYKDLILNNRISDLSPKMEFNLADAKMFSLFLNSILLNQ